jgi:hypothetical protein
MTADRVWITALRKSANGGCVGPSARPQNLRWLTTLRVAVSRQPRANPDMSAAAWVMVEGWFPSNPLQDILNMRGADFHKTAFLRLWFSTVPRALIPLSRGREC